jgi:hypothetical protein
MAWGCAQTPATPGKTAGDEKAAVQPSGPLAPLAWLEGCWRGSVNRREFREHWLPLRGDLLLGTSHIVVDGNTQDFAFLRIEPRSDGVWYVTLVPGQPEVAFRMSGVTTDKERGDTIAAFDNPKDGFPRHLEYRRGSEGWLYAQVEGTVAGADRKVIYPMRRVDCESGELIRR